MFEKRHEPLLSRAEFARRLIRYSLLSGGIILISLAIGVVGYHLFEGLSWLDSLLNASMLLGGMGPVDKLNTNAGKIFASCYALFSGLILLVAAGVLISPLFHRFLHYFHMEIDDDDNSEGL
ncbi:MAG TPA: hypothetical protein VGJ22_06010 [Anaerolineales bacterium]|jgi:hypothetical protein